MAKYYFHTPESIHAADLEGVELSSIDDARREAIRAASKMLSEHFETHGVGRALKMRVTDETGNLVCRLDFSVQ